MAIQVLLISGSESGQRRESQAVTDRGGRYQFTGLSVEPGVSHVLRVLFRGEDFLGQPFQFEPGQTELEFGPLLLSVEPRSEAGAEARTEARAGEGLPPSHPPIPGQGALLGKPVPLNPGLTLLLVILTVAAFALPLQLLRRRDLRREGLAAAGPMRALVRDLASLDNRFEAGELPAEEYRSIRESLMRRLRELAQGVPEPSPRPEPSPSRAQESGVE